MPGDKNLTEEELLALIEEHRADEHAARVRDFGEADAATNDVRMAEAFRHREEAQGQRDSSPIPVITGEINRVVADLERGWQKPYERLLQEAADRGASRISEREPER